MAENVERVSKGKVSDQIIQDGRDAGRKAIEQATKPLVERGFDPTVVETLVKQGIREAAGG